MMYEQDYNSVNYKSITLKFLLVFSFTVSLFHFALDNHELWNITFN